MCLGKHTRTQAMSNLYVTKYSAMKSFASFHSEQSEIFSPKSLWVIWQGS